MIDERRWENTLWQKNILIKRERLLNYDFFFYAIGMKRKIESTYALTLPHEHIWAVGRMITSASNSIRCPSDVVFNNSKYTITFGKSLSRNMPRYQSLRPICPCMIHQLRIIHMSAFVEVYKKQYQYLISSVQSCQWQRAEQSHFDVKKVSTFNFVQSRLEWRIATTKFLFFV